MRNLAITLSAILIFSLISINFAQDAENPVKPETEEKSPQTQPAKKYKIFQSFDVGMVFEKHTKYDLSIDMGNQKRSVSMITNIEITILKADKGIPKSAKVKFLKTELTGMDSKKAPNLNIDLKGHWVEGTVDEHLMLKIEKKSPEFPAAGENFIIGLQLIEFSFPKKVIAVGEKWDSGKEILGKSSAQFPGDFETTTTLTKILKDNDETEKSAIINMTVDATMKIDEQERKLTGNAEYNYDLQKNRIVSSKMNVEIIITETQDNQKMVVKMPVTSTVEYKYSDEDSKDENNTKNVKPEPKEE